MILDLVGTALIVWAAILFNSFAVKQAGKYVTKKEWWNITILGAVTAAITALIFHALR